MKNRKSSGPKTMRQTQKPPVHENPALSQQRRRQLATHYAARYRSR